MNQPVARLSERFIPILTLLLLSTPLSYIGDVCHETGHGLLALAQGGTFTGIVIGRTESYALANSYLVSIGGWMGQYALAAFVVLLSWGFKPKSFLGKSAVVMLVLQNLINPPAYMASLQGDSARTLQILEATGIGNPESLAILESAATVLMLIGLYVSWRIVRTYFSGIFQWASRRRSSLASLLFVGGSAASVWYAYSPLEGSVAITNPFIQSLFFLAFLIVFSFVVIPRPVSSLTRAMNAGPSLVTFAFVILLFLEAQLVYFFVLPVTIPFP